MVKDGEAARVPVAIGHRSAFEAEILGGIPAGAEVIVHPSDKITDGVKVEEENPNSR
jgi:HlyD family secretion protein